MKNIDYITGNITCLERCNDKLQIIGHPGSIIFSTNYFSLDKICRTLIGRNFLHL